MHQVAHGIRGDYSPPPSPLSLTPPSRETHIHVVPHLIDPAPPCFYPSSLVPHARLHPAPPTPFPRSSKGGYASGGGAGACDKDVLARWFLTEEGLSTNKIGMWLGGANDLNKETLRHFASLLSFRGRSLDGALRYFLSLFKLPGEAQQIDRIMQVVPPLPPNPVSPPPHVHVL